MTSTDTSDVGIIQSSQNDASSKMKLMIHNQLPGVELVSQVYYSIFATCYLPPSQCVDAGSTMQVDYNIETDQEESESMLMYKLQRKNIDQSNKEDISSEEETCIQLFIMWRFTNSKEFHVISFLAEHDEGNVLDRDGLIKIAKSCEPVDIQLGVQLGSVNETWLMHDNTVSMTSWNVAHEEECYKLEITISEASIRDNTRRPRYMDVDR
jgi:hypothetical protein